MYIYGTYYINILFNLSITLKTYDESTLSIELVEFIQCPCIYDFTRADHSERNEKAWCKRPVQTLG